MAEAAVKFECALREIEYLCYRGHLPYLPGRPALIDEADIPGSPEFEALLRGQIIEKARRKLRAKQIKREVARILAEMKARKRND